MATLRLAALLMIVPAASSFAQVVDHSQARTLIGQEVTINGPVARVERLPNGNLRLSIGRSFEERSLEVIVSGELARLFGDGMQFQGRNVDVHGRILAAADPTQPGVPAILLTESGGLRMAPRRIVVVPNPGSLPPTGDSASRNAASRSALPPRWAFTVSPGFPLGGPTGEMKAKLLADGWTDPYCDYNRTYCHENPLIGSPSFAFTGAVTRIVNRRIEARGVFSYANLGRAEGRRGGVDMRTEWSTFMIGTVIAFTPLPQVRVGAGPLMGLLNSQRIDSLPRTVIRLGIVVEGGIRPWTSRFTFLELSASYRLLPKRSEGPWPGRIAATVVPAGPGTMQANFSHLSIALGFGIRFSGGGE